MLVSVYNNTLVRVKMALELSILAGFS